MDYYLDDDEMIQDYLEEETEHPFPHDEEFSDNEVSSQSNTHLDMNTQDPGLSNHTVTSALTEELNIEASSSKRNDDLNVHKNCRDIYSFERYNSVKEWRESSKKDSFEVREWKRTHFASPKNSHKNSSGPRKTCGSLMSTSLSKQPLESVRIDITETSYPPECHGVKRFPVEGIPSVPLTISSGRRFHVMINPRTDSKRQKSVLQSPKPHLLGTSIATLMAKSDIIAAKETLSSQLNQSATKSLDHSLDSHLWVDKHAPSAFSHLLSDEQTNRTVLYALRSWDPYVFHRDAPKLTTLRAGLHSQETEENKPLHDKRPIETNRVLLLSGPPGVGKTTLAHIIARHAGYEPLEVNASDDRSEATLYDKVIRAMESSTLTPTLQLGGKPNCVILDEVDGADAKNAIASLVTLIRAEIPSKGSKRKNMFLRRPIIFICNHKYAPALRPLLPFCIHFDVEPPSDQRLLARLRAILAKERLSCNDPTLLSNLIVHSAGDIRSCLFTLQFSATEARARSFFKGGVVDISLNLSQVLRGDGLKDARIDLASTVIAVFKKLKRQNGNSHAFPTSTRKVLSIVESYGETTKALECLFQNLLRVSYIDPTMERCDLAHEWLSCGLSHFSMPSAAVGAVHVLCRVETKADLSLSNKESTQAHFQKQSNMGILQKFVENLRHFSYETTISEIIPYALWMLSAADTLHRPVSSVDVLGKKEMDAFRMHVSTLRSLGLTYVPTEHQSRLITTEKSTLKMRLEPEIDCLVHYHGFKAQIEHKRQRIPSVLRELLAHAARIDLIRSRDQGEAKQINNMERSPLEFNAMKVSDSDTHLESNVVILPPQKKLKTGALSKNFLGIVAQQSKNSRHARKKALVGFNPKLREDKLTHTGSGMPLSQVIRFKYQKGFTQAVKTPCRMQDLL